jgi:heme exporter protein C
MATQGIQPNVGAARASAASAVVPGAWWKAITGLWMTAAILAGFLWVGAAPGFTMHGHGAKVIFFHVPCAWLASLAYVVAAAYAAGYLLAWRARAGGPPSPPLGYLLVWWARGSSPPSPLESAVSRAIRGASAWERRDRKCQTAMELGFLYAILTTVTGSIFSRNEWGSYWSWDPRQTSILILLLVFAAYLVLRGAVDDPDLRARLSSAYALISVVPGLFLLWVLPRIVETLHPNQAAVGGGLTGHFRAGMYGLAVPAFLLLFTWLFLVRLRALLYVERREAALLPAVMQE